MSSICVGCPIAGRSLQLKSEKLVVCMWLACEPYILSPHLSRKRFRKHVKGSVAPRQTDLMRCCGFTQKFVSTRCDSIDPLPSAPAANSWRRLGYFWSGPLPERGLDECQLCTSSRPQNDLIITSSGQCTSISCDKHQNGFLLPVGNPPKDENYG